MSKIPYNKLTNSDKENIINNYYKNKSYSFKYISEILNVSERSISRVLKESSINTNLKGRYIIKNTEYFKTIDTEFKAYILGFIYADGFIGDNNDIAINLSDKVIDNYYLLNKLNEEIDCNKPISHHYNTTKNGESNGYWSFRIVNNEIWNDLNKLGIYPRKSLTMSEIPNIDSKLYNHFIRGYFDGDGSICSYIDKYDNRERNLLEIIGTEMFLNKIQDILVYNCNITKTKLHKSHPTEITRISYKGNKSIIKIRDYLYNNSTIYIKYKHDKIFNI